MKTNRTPRLGQQRGPAKPGAPVRRLRAAEIGALAQRMIDSGDKHTQDALMEKSFAVSRPKPGHDPLPIFIDDRCGLGNRTGSRHGHWRSPAGQKDAGHDALQCPKALPR